MWFFYMLLILGILFLSAYLSSAKFKGKLGEFVLSQQAKTYLDPDVYHLLENCTLPDGQGATTQIDHILLSPYGIFVIECKNYQGWIFGSERQKTWTQKFHKKSFKFQNPLHQNYKHLKVLEQLLEDIVDAEYLHSLVVFTPQSSFKTPMPANVVQGKAWLDYVRSFGQEELGPMKLKRVRYRIEKEALDPSWKTDRLHVQNLKQAKIAQPSPTESSHQI